MKMQGERLIRAAREDVWAALNDPEVLKQCIPGCEEIQKTTDTDFVARVKAKVGPVSLTMSGNVHLSDLEPPARYRISGQGKGGAAGFAKGGADIRLDEQDGGTLIAYDVDAQVGGKLAQIGNRLINSTARKMADDFFTRFVSIVESETAAPAEDPATALEPQSTGAKRGAASKPARAATTARKVATSSPHRAEAASRRRARPRPVGRSPAEAHPPTNHRCFRGLRLSHYRRQCRRHRAVHRFRQRPPMMPRLRDSQRRPGRRSSERARAVTMCCG